MAATCRWTTCSRPPCTGVFCAGEPTGIGGVELALVEGQIAGLAAAGHDDRKLATAVWGTRKARRFARLLDRTFASAPGVERLAFRRDVGMPLRGCSVFSPAGTSIVAGGKVAYAMRHGTVPGTNLRAGHTVSVSVDSGFGPAADISRACRKSGGTSSDSEPEHSESQEALNELEGRNARNHDLLQRRSQHRSRASWSKHCRLLLDNGCTGIVALGSLGEGATLTFDEKLAILRNCVNAVHGRGAGSRGNLRAFDSGGRVTGEGRGGRRLRRADGVCLRMSTRATGAR